MREDEPFLPNIHSSKNVVLKINPTAASEAIVFTGQLDDHVHRKLRFMVKKVV